jgi:hypothetical protein
VAAADSIGEPPPNPKAFHGVAITGELETGDPAVGFEGISRGLVRQGYYSGRVDVADDWVIQLELGLMSNGNKLAAGRPTQYLDQIFDLGFASWHVFVEPLTSPHAQDVRNVVLCAKQSLASLLNASCYPSSEHRARDSSNEKRANEHEVTRHSVHSWAAFRLP